MLAVLEDGAISTWPRIASAGAIRIDRDALVSHPSARSSLGTLGMTL